MDANGYGYYVPTQMAFRELGAYSYYPSVSFMEELSAEQCMPQ